MWSTTHSQRVFRKKEKLKIAGSGALGSCTKELWVDVENPALWKPTFPVLFSRAGMGSRCSWHCTNSLYDCMCDLFPTKDYLLLGSIQLQSGVTDIRLNFYQTYWQMLPYLNSHWFHMNWDQNNDHLYVKKMKQIYKCIIEDINNNTVILGLLKLIPLEYKPSIILMITI